jgi:hypothetical protein
MFALHNYMKLKLLCANCNASGQGHMYCRAYGSLSTLLSEDCWHGSVERVENIANGDFNVLVATVIQQRGAWIEHIIDYVDLTQKDLVNFKEIWEDRPTYYKKYLVKILEIYLLEIKIWEQI